MWLVTLIKKQFSKESLSEKKFRTPPTFMAEMRTNTRRRVYIVVTINC